MRIIQVSCLGHLGCFGNSVQQFVFAKSYAEFTNSKLEIPKDWIGRRIFNIKEDNIKQRSLPTVSEENIQFGETNLDIYGFFQDPKFYKLISLSKCREWLSIQDKWLKKFPANKKYYIACHLRRGDFVILHHSYPVIQEIAYLNSVYKHNYDSKDVIWVGENIPQLDDECTSLGIDFLPDFLTLINADVLFRGPSTFGFWAGVIGNNIMYSPEVDFPDYGNGRVGFINDVEFNLGLGPHKEDNFEL